MTEEWLGRRYLIFEDEVSSAQPFLSHFYRQRSYQPETGFLIWEYSFGKLSPAGVLPIFFAVYLPLFMSPMLVISLRNNRRKVKAIGAIYTIACALNVIAVGFLGWNYCPRLEGVRSELWKFAVPSLGNWQSTTNVSWCYVYYEDVATWLRSQTFGKTSKPKWTCFFFAFLWP